MTGTGHEDVCRQPIRKRMVMMVILILLALVFSACGGGGAGNQGDQPSGEAGEKTEDSRTGTESVSGEEVGGQTAPEGDPAGKGTAPGSAGSQTADGESPASPAAVSGSGVRPPNRAPVLYYQFDERWAKDNYDDAGNNDTVRRWACGPAVMAMAVATLKDKTVDPGKAAAWSLKKGYYTPDLLKGKTTDGYFAAYGKEYGLKVTQLNDGDLRKMGREEADVIHEKAAEAVSQGNWVVCLMGEGKWTTAGHFVLWYDLQAGGEVLIRDSNSKKEYKARNKLAALRETVVRYWRIEVDEAGGT